MNRPTGRFSAAVAAAVLAGGCAVGPDFKRPSPPEVQRYTSTPLPDSVGPTDAAAGPAQHLVQGMDIPAQWWALFHSPPLNRMVERVLKANPTLQAAQATLRQSQEIARAAAGPLFPAVNAGVAASRQQVRGAQFGLPATPGSLFTVYNASVSVSYGLDIFGTVRRTVEAREAEAEFQRFQLEGAYVTLASNVVAAAVQEASLRAQIAATREIVDVESQQLDLLERQFNVGAVSESSVLAQRTALAQTRASLPLLEKQLALLRNQLAVLTGSFPSDGDLDQFDLETLILPQELPVSLPSRLVEQRPDVRASESLLHAASAGIGIATANMLPQFTISGGAGSVATTAGSLFKSGSGIWSVGAEIAQPLFRGGTLLHERRAAIAAYEGAAADYRSVVLSAFQDVANVLDALQLDAAILQAQALAARSASESLDIARRQYQAGAANYLALLNAQQAYQQTRIALAQARAGRYADTAALFQALGGGWWNRDKEQAAEQPGAGK